jgi:hypothetical protein
MNRGVVPEWVVYQLLFVEHLLSEVGGVILRHLSGDRLEMTALRTMPTARIVL